MGERDKSPVRGKPERMAGKGEEVKERVKWTFDFDENMQELLDWTANIHIPRFVLITYLFEPPTVTFDGTFW